MTWVKVDDGWYTHPKALSVSLAARGLWLAGLCYSGHHLTDGRIPARVLGILASDLVDADALAGELVDAGLWTTTDGGWVIHDWGDHQRTKEEATAASEKAKKAARARWKGRDATEHAPSSAPSMPDASDEQCDEHAPSNANRNAEQSRAEQSTTPPTPPSVEHAPDLDAVWSAMAQWALEARDDPPTHPKAWLRGVERSLAEQHTDRATELLNDGHTPYAVAEILAARRPGPRRGLGCEHCTDGFHVDDTAATPCSNCNPAARPRLEAVR